MFYNLKKNNLFSHIQFIFYNLKSSIYLVQHWQKKRYRHSRLGRFWAILFSIIFCLSISIVWSIILDKNFIEYFSYIFVSLNIWWFMSQVITESPRLYSNYKSVILNINTSFIKYNFFIILYQIVNLGLILPFFILILFLNENFNIINLLYIFVGLIINFFFLFFLSIIFSILNLIFRDIEHLIKTLIPLATLITPILWKAEMLGNFEKYIHFNPFYSFLTIVRNPILNENTSLFSYLICLVLTLLVMLVCFFLVKKFGNKIVYYL